jgi:hypothetical protein
MNSLIETPPAIRSVQELDVITKELAMLVANRWPDAYPDKPVIVPGAEILDDDGQPFTPPRFGQETTAMVPDIVASQGFWDAAGTAGFALCAGHAILGNGANFKHLLAGGELAANDPVMLAGHAFMGAALAFRAACEAKGGAFMAALPVKVVPPFDLAPDSTGKIVVTPKA